MKKIRGKFFDLFNKFFLGCGFVTLLSACTQPYDAPVEDLSKSAPKRPFYPSATLQPNTDYYRVKSKDTLYSIAWIYGIDYRLLAAINHLSPPYKIQVNQLLYLNLRAALPPTTMKFKAGRQKKAAAISAPLINYSPLKAQPINAWQWPVRGRILSAYSENPVGNKGINIAGQYGQIIRASAAGVIVYSGDGIRGYSNLIIIKHNTSYLSAYAFNKINLVKEGAHVKAGQIIAQMGRDNGGKIMLHFEIRRNGKPVDPLQYLNNYPK